MRTFHVALVAALAASGCTSTTEHQARSAMEAHGPPIHFVTSATPQPPAQPFDGKLDGYVQHARRHSPLLRQRYAEWEAAVARIDGMRVLPEPTVRYTVFLRAVETRVGPQRHKLGVTQAFPWPTVISAGVDEASLAALSAAKRYDAEALLVAQRVASAYWALWLVAREHRILGEQLQVLRGLAEAARARVEIGNAGLAHLSQAQLAISKLFDRRAGLARVRRRGEARLRRALSVPVDTVLPIDAGVPRVATAGESDKALSDALRDHPALESVALMAASREASSERAEAGGFPRFGIGADWTEVGPATTGAPADSGKDAVSISVMVTVPLWRGVYNGRRDAALADSRAMQAKRDVAHDAAAAELEMAQADLQETLRQTRLYSSTLLPQAESTMEATLGDYQVGQLSLAAVLLAQRDLFALQLALDQARAGNRQAWARLEATVGRTVRAKEEVGP